MPDTANHRADMHVLATERKRAGLPVWDRRIDFADVFHAEHLTFTERRDAIAARLRGSAWLSGRGEMDELVLLVDELAEAEDIGAFDDVWDQVYDFADDERVWIGTS